jgi:hypothetical protein
MPTIHLIGLVCEKTKEAIDEPYLTAHVDGRNIGTIWGPQKMNDGDARRIYWSRNFGYVEDAPEPVIRISLYEDDRRGTDDHIGDLSLSRDVHEAGEVRHVLEGHRARYVLSYEIRSGSRDNTVLELISLHCNDASERTDEPYLTVNGGREWGPASMRTGDDQRIHKDVIFNRIAVVELWESDPGRSERIGSPLVVDHRIAGERSCRVLGLEEAHRNTFNGDLNFGDASYTLTYCVRRRRP